MADKTILFDVQVQATEAVKQIAALNNKIDELKNQQGELQTRMKGLDVGSDKYKELQVQLTANLEAQKAYRKEVGELSRGVQNTIIQQSNKYSDTLKGLCAQLSVAKDRLRATKGASGELSDAYVSQLKQVNALNDKIKTLEFAYGVYTRNVGNYKSGVQDLNETLRKHLQNLSQLKEGTKEWEAESQAIKDCSQELDELNREQDKAESKQEGFFSKAKAGWLAVVAAVMALVKAIKSIMGETQKVGDAITVEIEGWKAAYHQFVADLSSGKGWRELINNISETYAKAKQLAVLLDEMFERRNSLAIMEAENAEAIEQNKIIARDVTKSYEERLAAAEKVLELEESIATERRKVAFQELEIQRGKLQDRTDLNQEELEFYVNRYNQNIDIIRQAQDYNAALKEQNDIIAANQRAQSYATNPSFTYSSAAARIAGGGESAESPAIAAAQAEIARIEEMTDAEVKRIAEIARKYDMSNDEMVQSYVNAYTEWISIDADYTKKTARTQMQRSALIKQMLSDETKDYKNQTDEQDKELKEQEKNFETYVATMSSVLLEIMNPDKVKKQIMQIEQHYADLIDGLEEQWKQGNITFEEATYYRYMLTVRMNEDIKTVEAAAAADRDKEEKARIAQETQEKQAKLKRDLQLAWDNENEQFRIRRDFLLKELEMENLAADERAKLEQQLTELFRTEQAKRIDAFMNYVGQFESLMQGVSDLYANQADARVQIYEEQNAEEKAALDKRLKAGLISQRQYDDKVARMDKELADKKAEETRKQAEREKALAVFQIAINTAQAIMKIWAEVPKMDFGVSTAALTAVAVALGAVQAAAVMSQPLPKAARGGLIQGASHEQGGVLLEAEGGERIVAAEPSRAFPELLNLISYIGKHSSAPETGYALRNSGNASGETDYDRLAEIVKQAVSEVNIWLSLQELRDAQQTQVQIEQLAKQ